MKNRLFATITIISLVVPVFKAFAETTESAEKTKTEAAKTAAKTPSEYKAMLVKGARFLNMNKPAEAEKELVQIDPEGKQYYSSAKKLLAFSYRLTPQMPVDIQVRPARVYEYYNPERQGFSQGVRLSVVAKDGPG